MQFFRSLSDILIILLLLRLGIRPNEVFLSPAHRLICRLTDPLIKPLRTVSRKQSQNIVLTMVGLVLLRGLIYSAVTASSLLPCIAISLLDLINLVFQYYVVVWLISFLLRDRLSTVFSSIMERALLPVQRIVLRLRNPRQFFQLSLFLFMLASYVLLGLVTRSLFSIKDALSLNTVLYSLGEGLILVLSLFTFPGFFSVIIVLGALLSWFSPDPSNPLVQAIYAISEPLLIPFRRLVPTLGGLDISPILALLCFQFLGGLGQELISSLIRV